MIKRGLLSLLLLWLLSTLSSNLIAHADTRSDFMTQAIALAQASQRETGVPASVTLAQAIFESAWGQKPISDANNYFGVKAGQRSDGTINVGKIAIGWVWAWTKEWDGARYVEVQQRFRKYRNMAESFRDHGYVILENPRYAQAMRHIDDAKEFARRIAQAGYATAPSYADSLIDVMDRQNLYQYDLPRDAAKMVRQSDPLIVEPGQVFEIYFELQNAGYATWRQHENYYLANVNNVTLGARAEQQLFANVAPGNSGRWTIRMIAPSSPGTYRTQWRLRRQNQTIGPEMHIDIQVRSAGPVRNEPFTPIPLGVGLATLLGVGLWAKKSYSNRKARRAKSARAERGWENPIGIANIQKRNLRQKDR